MVAEAAGRWSAERAWAWADALPVLIGCNYVPATAINQVEMWSGASWDPDTIERELAAAAKVGFNALRVYLHDQVWRAEGTVFLARIDAFLSVADRHGFATLLVLFDDCWHEPAPNPQPAPRPGVHNSGWARSPGRERLLDRSCWDGLERYARAAAQRFGGDRRVLGWDVYNEPCNVVMPMALGDDEREAVLTRLDGERAQMDAALDLMTQACGWLRDEGVTQPLTIGVFQESDALGVDARAIPLSDVVSFHHYGDADDLAAVMRRLERHGRPLMCTEYLNRPAGCTFESHLTGFAAAGIPAFNWGLVDGKTQTKFAWTDAPGGPEPDSWFHDVLRADLTPYDDDEAALIGRLRGEAA